MVAAPAPRTRSRHGYHTTQLERAQTRRNYAEITERGVQSLAHMGPAVEGISWGFIFYSLYRAARALTVRDAAKLRDGIKNVFALATSPFQIVKGMVSLPGWDIRENFYGSVAEMIEATAFKVGADPDQPLISHVDALIVASTGIIAMKTALEVGKTAVRIA